MQQNRGPNIQLVFREMWDTTTFDLPLRVRVIAESGGKDGCPTFAKAYVGRKRWAKPNNRFHSIDQRTLTPQNP